MHAMLGQCKNKKKNNNKPKNLDCKQTPDASSLICWEEPKTKKTRRLSRQEACGILQKLPCENKIHLQQLNGKVGGLGGGCKLLHLHTCMKVAVMEGRSFEDKRRCTLTLIYIDDCSESHIPDMENLVFPLFKTTCACASETLEL